ncbi:MAG: FtsQ-type POTRA domain-containing protein [Bacteroidota bacterium]
MLVLVAGGFGWWWKGQVVVRNVQIEGVQHAEETVLREMMRVDSSHLFFDIDPVMVSDRLRRHPWVKEARVQRYPNATLQVDVEERVPALLALDDSGAPVRYLDVDGFQMPFVKGAIYDVPLLHGFNEPMQGMRPIMHRALQKLLQDMQRVPPEVDALVSAFEIEESGEISLHTTPKPGRGSIEVLLGRDQFVEKLSKLYAFWHEAVLEKEDVDFASIDLRFDSQIITKEVRLSQ